MSRKHGNKVFIIYGYDGVAKVITGLTIFQAIKDAGIDNHHVWFYALPDTEPFVWDAQAKKWVHGKNPEIENEINLWRGQNHRTGENESLEVI